MNTSHFAWKCELEEARIAAALRDRCAMQGLRVRADASGRTLTVEVHATLIFGVGEQYQATDAFKQAFEGAADAALAAEEGGKEFENVSYLYQLQYQTK